ncbi:NAD(P)/FAD-dependent oxidoreductase [Amycolatopsis thermoflava]|uniref:Pyridine nucleotide-disulfide oxidoreductase n=1 Tax=Amycolatopsis thermoflava TaxID=84480 RepID=A0A3N2H566_9PSEU|nr:FAD-dependent oxidoreductase [Amycolatopsis thermoflava]ROS43255.1 pyridine nucleotide-disulfide oxidoreductase [Amycolatopsis thermoflava]
MSDGDRIVIVGAGVAGLRAAERLRELGFDGELVIVGDEARKPYHRPMVSKQLMMGTVRPSDATLQTYTDLDAHWRLGTRATHLDTLQRVVHLPGGEELWYDGLVIATGVVPRHLPGSPRHDPRVRVLRTVEDAAAVRKALAASNKPAVVIGSGLIGCEFAASMRQMGRDVTLVGHARAPLHRFGTRIAEAVTDIQLKHRASLAMRSEVRHWIETKDAFGLHLTNNKLVVASCVVLAIGSVPAVDWLRGSGLVIEDGVLCESTLFAVDADDVVVAGDVACWPNLRFDEVPRRVEHWLNAVESGRAAAENLMAGRRAAQPFTPMPRAWSSLYDARLQMAGMPALADDTVQLAQGVTGFVRGGKLVGAAGWDRPRAMLHWTAELHRRLPAPATVPAPEPAEAERVPDSPAEWLSVG